MKQLKLEIPIWRVPEIGVPPNHPAICLGFSVINHPAIGVPPLWKPSYGFLVKLCDSNWINISKAKPSGVHMGNLKPEKQSIQNG